MNDILVKGQSLPNHLVIASNTNSNIKRRARLSSARGS